MMTSIRRLMHFPFYRFWALLIFLLFQTALFSQTTIYVDDDNMTGPWDGTEAHPYKLIQDGINAALPSEGQLILVLPGTYEEDINFLGKLVTVKSRKGPEATMISGEHSVVVFNHGEDYETVLDGFTITNGKGTYYSFDICGGGIFCLGSSPIIRNNILTGNTADNGGGIWCEDSFPIINRNVIIENAANHEGGGIFCLSSSPRIIENSISGNFAKYRGGGISAFVFSDPLIKGNTITNNSANSAGGGISCNGSSSIINNLIQGNYANGLGGGVICNGGFPLIENNIILDNGSSSMGGGISLEHSSAVIGNNMIIKNHSHAGGGISFNLYSSVLKNTTISDNTATAKGGGIFIWKGASPTIINSILSNNSAEDGKEFWAGSTSQPSSTSISYSLLEGGSSSVHVEPGCSLEWGQGMLGADPLLLPGPHGLCYLSQIAAGQAQDSPCLDAGSDTALNLEMGTYWTRSDGVFDTGIVDMGAHFGPFSSIYLSPLYPDAYTISQSTGGTITFNLSGGVLNEGRTYLLLGSMSGTSPGHPLPGGKVVLPLIWDGFTDQMIPLINSPCLRNFYGELDACTGSAKSMFNPGVFRPEFIGIRMYFFFCLGYPYDFASNSVMVELLP